METIIANSKEPDVNIAYERIVKLIKSELGEISAIHIHLALCIISQQIEEQLKEHGVTAGPISKIPEGGMH